MDNQTNFSRFFILLFMAIAFTSCNDQGYKNVSYFTINDQGDLVRPTDYRSWIYVGTPLTPNELNPPKAAFPEFHNVYIDPMSYDHYKETGKFREGTILIKELISVGSKAAVSGNGYFMGEFIGLEATIKSKEHFPNEPGNWAYFSFTNPAEGTLADTGKPFKTNQCNSCHDGSAADDFVFTQYYPVLSAAKGAGKDVTPENAAARTAGEKKKQVSKWDPTVPTPDGDFGIPLDQDNLFAYLQSKAYQKFKNKENALHPSLGPHTKLGLPVKVYMNDAIAESLTKGNDQHPIGSTVVKEMYSDKNELSGWAVMVKTNETTDDGKGWYWYEVTSVTDSKAIAAMGNGVVGCFDCHNQRGSRDMVRTSFPLK